MDKKTEENSDAQKEDNLEDTEIKKDNSVTKEIKTHWGMLHLTIVYNEKKTKVKSVFANIGKSGSVIRGKIEAICRLINLALRHRIEIKEISKELIGIKEQNTFHYNGYLIESIPDLFGKILEEEYKNLQK